MGLRFNLYHSEIVARRAAWHRRALLIAGALMAVGCRSESDSAPAASRPVPVESTVRRGGVTLTVRADRDRIAVADRLGLSVIVTAPHGVDVTLPAAVQTLGDFNVRSSRDIAAIPEGNLRRSEQRIELECDLSGKQTIPAMTVRAAVKPPTSAPAGAAEATTPEEIMSEPLVIEVTSELSGPVDLTKFRDIKGALAIPTARAWKWIAAAAGVVAVGIAALWWWKRRGRREAVVPAIPPHIWAREELARLALERFAERGLFHEYYFRLSGIVRQYIERRFGLMAPERTTEEFLVEARRSVLLNGHHKELLAAFLRACDEVKFARYEPSLDEAARAISTARDFVAQTHPVEVSAAPVEAAV